MESQIGISKDYNIFELKSAIINRNIFKAYQIMKYFDKNPKSGSLFGMLPQLFAYFQNLMIAYYVPKNNDEQELARYFGFSYTWQARDYIIGMRNYSGVKTMQIISKIREIDAKSKGLDNPNTSAGELMKELFYFILHWQKSLVLLSDDGKNSRIFVGKNPHFRIKTVPNGLFLFVYSH